MALFIIVAPIFALILLGWVARRFGLVKESAVDVLTGFVYYIALPALIVQSLLSIQWDANSFFALTTTSGLLLVMCAVVFMGLSVFVKDRQVRASFFLIAVIANTVYMGYPIMAGFFGHATAGTVAAIAVLQLVIGVLAGLVAMEYWIDRRVSVVVCAQCVSVNPLFISVVAGIIASMIPSLFAFAIIAKPLSMLAATASPVALFALGAFMYAKFNQSHFGLVLGASLFKVAVMPLVAFVVLRAIGLTGEAFSAAVICAGMPVAITAFVFSQQSKLKGSLVGSAIIVSTVMSFITLPIALLILSR